MAKPQKIGVCLWFDNQAEEAARFYTGIFKDSRLKKVLHYSDAGQETHRKTPGSVMTVHFELNGTPFTALNGGPEFKFTEAVSLEIHCADQDEVDYYWDRLTPGGDPNAQVCGWLKDKFGVSWQVIPTEMNEMLEDAESPGAKAVTEAFMKMKKIDIATLREAYESAGAQAW